MQVPADETVASLPARQSQLGVSVRPLTRQEMAQAQVTQGLLVEKVGTGPAANAGIQPGDVILAVNGDPVASVAQLQDRLSHSKSVALLVMRGEERIYVPMKTN